MTKIQKNKLSQPSDSTTRNDSKKLPTAPANFHIEQRDFGDFLQSLEQGGVDLVLTDPPYTISRKTGFKNVKNGVQRFAVEMDFGKWDHAQIDLNKMSDLIYRVLKIGGTTIIWYDLWKVESLSLAMQAAGFKMLRLLIWEKTNPVPLNQRATYLSNSREVAVVGVKVGKPTFNSQYDSGIYHHPIPRHNGKRIHPTQKPVDLFQEIIEKHSNPGDLVVDPFLGSGTTAVAALAQNRNFVGCDIDAGYTKAAKARVKRFVSKMHLQLSA